MWRNDAPSPFAPRAVPVERLMAQEVIHNFSEKTIFWVFVQVCPRSEVNT